MSLRRGVVGVDSAAGNLKYGDVVLLYYYTVDKRPTSSGDKSGFILADLSGWVDSLMIQCFVDGCQLRELRLKCSKFCIAHNLANEASWLTKSYTSRNQTRLNTSVVCLSGLWPWMLGMRIQVHRGNRNCRSYIFFLFLCCSVFLFVFLLANCTSVAEAVYVCDFS